MTATVTSRLNLPFLQAGQSLKNITHNETLQRLDAGLYLFCSDMAADQLPSDPVEGQAQIISQSPNETLMDRIGQIGVYWTNWGLYVWRLDLVYSKTRVDLMGCSWEDLANFRWEQLGASGP